MQMFKIFGKPKKNRPLIGAPSDSHMSRSKSEGAIEPMKRKAHITEQGTQPETPRKISEAGQLNDETLEWKKDQVQKAYYCITQAETAQKIIDKKNLSLQQKKNLYGKLLYTYLFTEEANESEWHENHPLHPDRIDSAIEMQGKLPHCNYSDKEIEDTFDILTSRFSDSDHYGTIIESLNNAMSIIEALFKKGILKQEEYTVFLAERKEVRNNYICADFERFKLEVNESTTLHSRQAIIRDYITSTQEIMIEWDKDLEAEQSIDLREILVEDVDFRDIDISKINITAKQLSTVKSLARIRNLDHSLKLEAERIKAESMKKRSHQRSTSLSQRGRVLYQSKSKSTVPSLPNINNLIPSASDSSPRLKEVIISSIFQAIDDKDINLLTLLLKKDTSYIKNKISITEWRLDKNWLKKEILEFEFKILSSLSEILTDQYGTTNDSSNDTKFTRNSGYLKQLRNQLFQAPYEIIDYEAIHKKISLLKERDRKNIWFTIYNFNLLREGDIYEKFFKQELDDVAGQQQSFWIPFIEEWSISMSPDSDKLLNALKRAHSKKQQEINNTIKEENRLKEQQKQYTKEMLSAKEVQELTPLQLSENISTFPKQLRDSLENNNQNVDLKITPNIKHRNYSNSLLAHALGKENINLEIIKLLLACNANLLTDTLNNYQPIQALQVGDKKLAKEIYNHIRNKSLTELINAKGLVFVMNNPRLKECLEIMEKFKKELDNISSQLYASSNTNNQAMNGLQLAIVYEKFLNSAKQLAPHLLLAELKQLIEKFMSVSDEFNLSMLSITGNMIQSLEAFNYNEFTAALYKYNIFKLDPFALIDETITAEQIRELNPGRSKRSMRLSRQLLLNEANSYPKINQEELVLKNNAPCKEITTPKDQIKPSQSKLEEQHQPSMKF